MPNAATNMPLLIPDGFFACPRCGPTNAVTQLIAGGGLGAPLSGRCKRCEHAYTFVTGSPATTTTGVNAQGATTLTVTLGTGFTSASWVIIDSASVAGGAEVLKTSGAGGATTIPVAATPLRLTHAAGATVQTATLVPLGSLT